MTKMLEWPTRINETIQQKIAENICFNKTPCFASSPIAAWKIKKTKNPALKKYA